MNGEELYQKWVEFHESRCIFIDPWDQLDSVDQAAWNYIATITSK